MSAIEAVIFDWGGTLSIHADIDPAEMWLESATHLAPARAEELRLLLAAAEERAWARTSADQLSCRLDELVREATTELGLDAGEEELVEAISCYLDAWTPHITHELDAPEVVAALHRRGLRTGLLSNTHWPRRFHEELLVRDGLVEFLDVRCYTSDMTYTKPHREAFAVVLKALDVDPARAVFVGDRPYDDIYGAKAIGMRTVLKPNRFVPAHDVEPDATIASLSELPRLIDSWSS